MVLSLSSPSGCAIDNDVWGLEPVRPAPVSTATVLALGEIVKYSVPESLSLSVVSLIPWDEPVRFSWSLSPVSRPVKSSVASTSCCSSVWESESEVPEELSLVDEELVLPSPLLSPPRSSFFSTPFSILVADLSTLPCG